jgi:DNA-binding CsgD family transcriptional regulator
VRAALPEPMLTNAWRHGRGLPLAAAINAARETLGAVGHRTSANSLSQRELEILKRLANGDSDREIAASLFISAETVATHVKNIRRKLGVRSRTAAAAWAIRHALI